MSETFEEMIFRFIDECQIDMLKEVGISPWDHPKSYTITPAGIVPLVYQPFNFHCSRRTVQSFNPPDQMPTPRIEKHKITVSYSRNARQWGCRIHHGTDLIFSTPFQYNRKQDARHAAEHLVINLRAGHFDYAVENARTGTMETMTQIFRP